MPQSLKNGPQLCPLDAFVCRQACRHAAPCHNLMPTLPSSNSLSALTTCPVFVHERAIAASDLLEDGVLV